MGKYINRSKDEQYLMYEDSRLGDMLTQNINPEKLWTMIEGEQVDDIDMYPEFIGGDGYQIEGEPDLYPEGECVEIPYTNAVIYENGCVVGDQGHVLHMARRDPNTTHGVPMLDRYGREIRADYYVRVTMNDGSNIRMRVAALMLEYHAGKPKPTANHTVWFKDGDFLNLRVENLRWVQKKNLRALSRG